MNVKKLVKVDPFLTLASFFILGLGLLTIFTSTYSAKTGISQLATHQSIFALVAVTVLVLTTFINYRIFRTISFVFYLLSLALLVLVLFVGKSVYGATSWLDIGFLQFQPSEITKIALVLILARFFSTRTGRISFKDIMISFALTLPALLLVLLQPDFGTAMVLMVIWLALVLSARPKLSHVGAIFLPMLAGLPIFWQLLKGYQKSRILVFVNGLLGRPLPQADILGVAYNVIQSQIAVGSGKIFGRGIGQGTQGALNFLPSQSQHTDFIFAIFTEQLGFIGGVLLIGLFSLLLIRIIRIAQISKDGFGMHVAMGIFAMIFFHALVSIGMNMGIMPVTGIPLPLFSYGGTALVATCLALGIVQSIYRHRQALEFQK